MTDRRKILLVDDDVALCQLLAEFLQLEGYEVRSMHDGEQVLDAGRNLDCDLIVLDIMMPSVSGLEVLSILRRRTRVPVIMLTGRGDELDRIIGLEMGADDYLSKPCNPRELAARIRAVLRRTQNDSPTTNDGGDEIIELHGIVFNPGLRKAFVDDDELNLTAVEFNVLGILMGAAGKVVSKSEMTEQVLHRKLSPYDRSIDVHVSRIRQKLARRLGNRRLIETVRGEGYQMLLERHDQTA